MVYWLIFCVVVGCTSTAVLAYRGRRTRHAPAVPTGAIVYPAPCGSRQASWSIVGGAVLPGTFGKTNATWPLGVMEGGDGWLCIRMRPAPMAALFGSRPFVASSTDDVEVFPARSMFGGRCIGVRAGHDEAYFAGFGQAELMGLLQSAGFHVSTDERKIVYL